MTTILRGHNFGSTDLCKAAALNHLVERARISNIGSSALGGALLGVSVYSEASGATVGWITAAYEQHSLTAGAGSYAELFYKIRTQVGDVALFKALGLETRRFRFVDTAIAPGSALLVKAAAGDSATLTCTFAYTTGYPQHAFIGGLGTETAASHQTDPKRNPRITIKGPFGCRVVDAGDTIRKYYYLLNAVTGQWQHSPSATNTDKVAGLAMRQTSNGSANLPAFLFGAPLWRA